MKRISVKNIKVGDVVNILNHKKEVLKTRYNSLFGTCVLVFDDIEYEALENTKVELISKGGDSK